MTWKIIGNYGSFWEDVSNGYDTQTEAEDDMVKYEIACPQGVHSVVKEK